MSGDELPAGRIRTAQIERNQGYPTDKKGRKNAMSNTTKAGTPTANAVVIVRVDPYAFTAADVGKEHVIKGVKFLLAYDPANHEIVLVSSAKRSAVEKATGNLSWDSYEEYASDGAVMRLIRAATKDATMRLAAAAKEDGFDLTDDLQWNLHATALHLQFGDV